MANAEYYRGVDWAIDIRHAEFQECDLRGIPAALVLRDEETQVVVTRSKVARGEWRGLDLSGTYWPTALALFLERGDSDAVLVAPKRAKNFAKLLTGLKMLRDAGVVEPPDGQNGSA